MRTWQGILIVALLALAPLAWLQYSWIGEISEAELNRRRQDLQAAAQRMARDVEQEFGRELSGLFPRLGPPSSFGARRFSPQDLESRIAEWKDEREEPGIVRTVRLVSTPPAPQPAIWIMPLGDQWMEVELDLEYLENKFFSELIRAHLGPSAAEQYALRLTDPRDGGRVLFQTGESHWEAEAGIFSGMPPGGFRRGGMRGPGGFRGPGIRGPGANPRWRLDLGLRDASLQAAVDRTRWRHLLLSGITLLLLAGSVVGLALVARRAERLSEAQLEFAAGVTHELKTPLAVIVAAGDNLAGGYIVDGEQVKRYGELVSKEGQRLTGMVEQVLGFAGIQTGRQEYAREPVDLRDVVQKVAGQAEGPVELEIVEPLPVTGDAMALQTAVRNLVENAQKHGGKGVAVRGWRDGDTVRLEVRDEGPGLAAEDMKQLFQPFYRGKRTRRQQVKGFGLGLALVKRVIEGHGGNVQAANNAGGGAAFTAELPARSEA